MKYILDTHVILWYLSEDPKLSTTAKRIVDGNYSGLNFNNIFQEVIKEEVGFDE